MARVYVSIGSNIERERSIRTAMSELQQRYCPLSFSSVYESEAVGFAGANFYNLVARFDTMDDVHTVAKRLREIEDRHGRDRTQPRFSSRTLDLDLLLYDNLVLAGDGLEIPRSEITRNAFVLLPLAEIEPSGRHPVLRLTFQELWERFDKSSQRLWPIDFPL